MEHIYKNLASPKVEKTTIKLLKHASHWLGYVQGFENPSILALSVQINSSVFATFGYKLHGGNGFQPPLNLKQRKTTNMKLCTGRKQL